MVFGLGESVLPSMSRKQSILQGLHIQALTTTVSVTILTPNSFSVKDKPGIDVCQELSNDLT